MIRALFSGFIGVDIGGTILEEFALYLYLSNILGTQFAFGRSLREPKERSNIITGIGITCMAITQTDLAALLTYTIGYLIFVVFSNLPIKWVTSDMWFDLVQSKTDRSSSNIDLSGKVGLIERTLYIGSFLAGKPEFIGIWLVLKVAGRFWKDENVSKADGSEVAKQAIFQVFLIGSGLSIAYAVIGAKCILWCLSGNFLFAAFFGASLIPITLILKNYPKLKDR